MSEQASEHGYRRHLKIVGSAAVMRYRRIRHRGMNDEYVHVPVSKSVDGVLLCGEHPHEPFFPPNKVGCYVPKNERGRATRHASRTTCSACLVQLDRLFEVGLAAVRADGTVLTPSTLCRVNVEPDYSIRTPNVTVEQWGDILPLTDAQIARVQAAGVFYRVPPGQPIPRLRGVDAQTDLANDSTSSKK